MTLTHIIPTLRASVPNPISRDLWPEFTTTTIADVTVAGVSLVRLAEWCGTPCVHTAAAVVPGTGGMPSATELASVVVARVVRVSRGKADALDVWIDARLDGTALAGETRMIGRVSTAADVGVRLRTIGAADDSADRLVVPQLVRDVRAGDLLAIPCRGAALLREVDPERRHLARDENAGQAPWAGLCGR